MRAINIRKCHHVLHSRRDGPHGSQFAAFLPPQSLASADGYGMVCPKRLSGLLRRHRSDGSSGRFARNTKNRASDRHDAADGRLAGAIALAKIASLIMLMERKVGHVQSRINVQRHMVVSGVLSARRFRWE